jgi:hypothetical protein
VDNRRYGKVLSKRNFSDSYANTFAAIGRTAKGEYKMFSLLTCYLEVAERNWVSSLDEEANFDISSAMAITLKISMPQLLSIIFFLLLLVFYLSIKELRKTEHGQCWINFLINSLINYSAAIAQLIYLRYKEDPLISTPFGRDAERTLIAESFTFQVSSTIIIYTEFSLYFWLNITFFEAFYMMR